MKPPKKRRNALGQGRQTRPGKKLDAGGLWDYGLRALGARALSTGEMRVRLSRRAENVEDVEGVLARLKDAALLDDRKFAENFAATRLESRGLGSQRVLRDLRGHRVAPALAEKAVAGAYATSDEVTLIEDFLARKYRNRDLPAYLADPAHLASAYRKLRYAGFSGGNAIRVLRRYSEMAGELDE